MPAESLGRLSYETGMAVQTQRYNPYPVADIAPVAQLFVRSDDGGHNQRRPARYGHLGEPVADIYTVKSHGPKSLRSSEYWFEAIFPSDEEPNSILEWRSPFLGPGKF